MNNREDKRVWTGCKRIPEGYKPCEECEHPSICKDHGAWESCKLQESERFNPYDLSDKNHPAKKKNRKRI